MPFHGKWEALLLGLSILFKQFTSNFANSGEIKSSEKTSSGGELRLSLSLTFFESSPSLDLSERSLFHACQVKTQYNQLYQQR